MAVRLFEGAAQAEDYSKFRFAPPRQIQELLFSYLRSKGLPCAQAVDVGCGTGLSTRILAPHFLRVLGTDISAVQLEQAARDTSCANVSYRQSPAEELPVPDSSVDLVTAGSAVHWFDVPRFLREVDRILRPGGCLALYCYHYRVGLRYRDCCHLLDRILEEVDEALSPYESERTRLVRGLYSDVYDAIAYSDKERVTDIPVALNLPVSAVMGYLSTTSMFQSFLRADPQAAAALLADAEERVLRAMGVSSGDAEVEMLLSGVCVLACKPPEDKSASP
ncbi:putative methyltransferase DDB_G0268948 [Amia ocellicauda]|uniref:putative methyltransferase DDB_G0268948 n=1 Tax=Amia ocellicauda TaxID=2972642 RepID=UPI003464C214